ncbi:MAG TPA: hypothetical protein VD978_32155 [Azospirillum sp.]|nr:hypothetical protein [Azospirillum sp.]
MDLLLLGATMALVLAGVAATAGARDLKPIRIRTDDRRRRTRR